MPSETKPEQAAPQHPIQVAANRAGLSAHAIRAWERRYGAILPKRSDTRRRLYSDEDIERLRLLRRAAATGRRISELATLSNAQLAELVDADKTAAEAAGSVYSATSSSSSSEEHVFACLAAVREMNAQGLEAALARASAALSLRMFLENVLAPLMRRIGQDWRRGALRVSHEHLASAITRSFLGNMATAASASAKGPKLVVTTPVGQVHELGALMVAVAAAYAGWKAIYLGPSVPAPEIAYTVESEQAHALALSISYPGDDPALPSELRTLGRALDPSVYVLVGGLSAPACASALREINAVHLPDLHALNAKLDELRGICA